jgi:hypothetical protein
MVGTMSATFANCCRNPASAPGAIRSGQCRIIGTWTPPSWVFCLYHLNGVLPHCAQPHG